MFRPNREFQAGLNQKEARRRRAQNSLQLRRKDRELKLQNKRKKILNKNNTNQTPLINISLSNSETHQKLLQNLKKFVQGTFNDHPATIYECIRKIRELTAIAEIPPIKKVIDSGVIPRIIQLLSFNKHPNIQFEAMWILTNISSTDKPEYTGTVVRNGAVPLFCKILKIQKYPLQEQAIWALGNISGECRELRDMVIANGLLEIFISMCKTPFNNNSCWCNKNTNDSDERQYITLLNTLSWTLSNLCRSGYDNTKEDTQYKLLTLKCMYYLISVKNKFTIEQRSEIEMNLAWSIQYLSANEDFEYDNVLLNNMNESGITKELIRLLNGSIMVYRPCVKAVGNILTGHDVYAQQCVNLGVLKQFYNLFGKIMDRKYSDKIDLMTLKELCWCMSNITACNNIEFIKCVISENIFPILCELTKITHLVSKEAIWSLANATSASYSNLQIMNYLCSQNKCNLIQYVCQWNKRTFENKNYTSSQESLLIISLECIENILMSEKDLLNKKYAKLFEEYGGVDFLEYLQTVDNISDNIYNKTINIIKQYFDGNNDDINQNNNYNNENQIDDISFN
eukprot:275869_1